MRIGRINAFQRKHGVGSSKTCGAENCSYRSICPQCPWTNYSNANCRMILIIQAMTELGENGMTDDVLSKLKEQLLLVSERDFIHDVKLAPIWAQTILKEL